MSTSIGVTERRVFRQCRLAWEWQYKERLELIDKSNLATQVGTYVHVAMARYLHYRMCDHNKVQPGVFEKVIGQLRSEYSNELTGERLAEAEELLRRYAEHRQDHRWEVLSIERSLEARIPHTRAWLTGRVDAFVELDGDTWVVDHKTARSYATPYKLETDDQVTAYIWLARQSGVPVTGVIYNELGKRKTPPYVQVTQVTRTDRQLASFEKNLTQEARDMTSKALRVYPSFGEHCGWCQMRSLCITAHDGGNVSLTKTAFYKYRPPSSDTVENGENGS